MAVVRITESLIGDVQHNIRQLYDPRRREVANFPGESSTDWGDKLWERAFSKYAPHIPHLPRTCFKFDEEFDIRGWRNGIGGVLDHTISLPMSVKRVVFNVGLDQLEDTGLTYNGYHYALNAEDPRWDDFKVEYIAWANAKAVVEAECLKAMQDAGALLRRFATLAPALKEWPALWDLLDANVKEQHRKIVTRAKANKPQVQSVVPDEPMPDLSSVTTMLALNKFNKANEQ